jgi:tRNA(Phe) wybutosine-synthesizing methylase Tyw3
MTRITIEVSGYRWRVHGSPKGDIWQTHLIELLGAERLDIPLDSKLQTKLREEIAIFLAWKVSDVKLTTDLILAW